MFSYAYADSVPQQTQFGLMGFLPMIGFMVILYFLLIRPQQKKQKAHQTLIASIKPGDKVMTNSGLLAKVVKILSDNEVVLEVADNVQCKFIKSTIISVINDSKINDNVSVKS